MHVHTYTFIAYVGPCLPLISPSSCSNFGRGALDAALPMLARRLAPTRALDRAPLARATTPVIASFRTDLQF